LQVRARLLKVGSMAESLGLYVPAMVLQKALGLARVFVFPHLISQAELGLWGLGLMIFLIAAPVATLGANHGLTRYVSLYEARGKLVAFYRRIQNRCALVVLAVTAVGFAASPWITRFVIVSSRPEVALFSYRQQLYVCLAALANVLVGGLYYDLLSFLFGMRAYRLASAAELAFSTLFMIFGVAGLALWPTALSLLGAHLLSQVAVLVGCLVLLQGALRQAEGYRGNGQDWSATEAEAATGEAPVPASDVPGRVGDVRLDRAFRRVLRFGFVAMVGNVLWLVAQHISFYLTNRHYGKEETGVFQPFLQLSQAVLLVSSSAFAVVFAHVAKRWEAVSHQAAMRTLETAYKAITLAMMAGTIVILAASPWWVRALPGKFHSGLVLLGGLLMFFQSVSNLSLLTSVARLRERPIVIALAALAGGVANVLLALWWEPTYGPAGAAWAAGIGMMAGGTAVTVAYFLAASVRIQPVSYLLMACPLLLLAPVWAAAVAWAAVVVVAVVTPAVFARGEKRVLVNVVSYALRQFFRKRAA
jgi:O-antigen/teichoic acid export membrane protein